MTLEPAHAYRVVRSRIDDLLRPLGAADVERPVPACPSWTVRQTLSHLVGVCSDVLAGRPDPAGSPDWTAAQVTARAGQPVPALLDEWATTGEQVAALLAGRSAFGQVVMDALSHEYDLRHALEAAVPEDDPVADVALGWLAPRFGRWLDGQGVPALRVELLPDGAGLVLGSGEPAATVRATRIDVLRSITGRRSLDQVRALDWDGDPAPWLPALTWGPFAPTATALETVAR